MPLNAAAGPCTQERKWAIRHSESLQTRRETHRVRRFDCRRRIHEKLPSRVEEVRRLTPKPMQLGHSSSTVSKSAARTVRRFTVPSRENPELNRKLMTEQALVGTMLQTRRCQAPSPTAVCNYNLARSTGWRECSYHCFGTVRALLVGAEERNDGEGRQLGSQPPARQRKW